MTKGSIELFEARERMIRRLARTPRCDMALRYFDVRSATGNDNAEFAKFQIDLLNSEAMLSVWNKSRQIGMSFGVALDALAEAIQTPRHNEVMVSFNLEEAREKILYATAWWDARCKHLSKIPTRAEFDESGKWKGEGKRPTASPSIVRANTLEIAFSNGSRLISHPSRPPRGKSSSVRMDEAAHIRGAKAIYQAALPMILRGQNKKFQLLSTPMGASGLFYEVMTDDRQYPDFERHSCGWWEVFDLCNDPVGARRAWAGGIDLDELVAKFGTRKMKIIRKNSTDEDYAQEFGLAFLDSVYAFLPWDLIRSCYPKALAEFGGMDVDADMDEIESFDADRIQREYDEAYFYRVAKCRRGQLDDAFTAIRELKRWIEATGAPGNFGWFYDVGRDRDQSEIAVFQFHDGKAMMRLMITMPQIDGPKQEQVCQTILRDLPITYGMMDKGGPGRLLADKLSQRYGYERCRPIWFTAESKDKLATNLKLRMQQGRVVLIPNRELERQLHSIKREVSGSGKWFVYTVDDSDEKASATALEHHHADKFWVVAMGAACIKVGGSSVAEGMASSEMQIEEAKRQMAAKGLKQVPRSKTRSTVVNIARKMGR